MSVRHSKNLKLCAFALMLALALGVTGCGSDSSGSGRSDLARIRLQSDWFPQPEHGGYYEASVSGLYKALGLEVEILPGGPNVQINESLLAGRSDMAMGSAVDVIVRRSRGMPVVIVAITMQHDPQALMLHASNPINTFADLDGRRVMASPSLSFIQALERKHNIKMDLIANDFGIERFLADRDFIQQCFVTSEPYFVRRRGIEPKVMMIADGGFDPYRVVYSTEEYIQNNPEAVRAFVQASNAGWRRYLESDAGSAANQRLIGLNLKLDAEFVDYVIETLNVMQLVAGDPGRGEAIGKMDRDRIQRTIDELAEIGLLAGPVTVEEVVFSGLLSNP